MITPESAPEHLAAILKNIKQAMGDNNALACADAFRNRKMRSIYYEGDLFVDIPHAYQWLWTAYYDAVRRTAIADPITDESLIELADRASGIGAMSRVLIIYLEEHLRNEQYLHSLVGGLDGLARMTAILLADLGRQKDMTER